MDVLPLARVLRLAALLLAPLLLLLAACGGGAGEDGSGAGDDEIRLGAPLSTSYLYGWAAERGILLAVEEINAAGGIQVGDRKLPLSVEVIDTRDLEPGVPVDDAIKAVERLILQKDVHFLVGGPVRSEAAMAVMDLLSTYRRPSILTTGALSPQYHQRVAENHEQYRYCFRISSEIVTLGSDLVQVFEKIRAEFDLSRVFIMVQDVNHARRAGEYVEGLLGDSGFEVVGHEVYPTGATDFAPGLLRRDPAQLGERDEGSVRIRT